jgi:hypothetical protein
MNNSDVLKSIQFKLLNPEIDGVDIQRIKRKIKKYPKTSLSLTSNAQTNLARHDYDDLDIVSVVKISKTFVDNNDVNSNRKFTEPQPEAVYYTASNLIELQAFSDILTNWTRKHVLTTLSNKTGKSSQSTKVNTISSNPLPRSRPPSAVMEIYNIRNKEALKNFLSMESIAWLHPTSYHPMYWDNMLNVLYGTQIYLTLC